MSEVTVFLSLADGRTVLKLMPEYKQRRDIVFFRQRFVTTKLTKENMLLQIIFTITKPRYFIWLPT